MNDLQKPRFSFQIWPDLIGTMDTAGLSIISSAHCVERVQFRFPRSKKRRIRNKWTGREANVRYEPRAYQSGRTIYAHPSFVAQLQAELENPLTAPHL
jgi:hypothetical protein